MDINLTNVSGVKRVGRMYSTATTTKEAVVEKKSSSGSSSKEYKKVGMSSTCFHKNNDSELTVQCEEVQ
jgi:hypothetical protein